MCSDDIAIRLSDLTKCYQIYDTPRDRLKQMLAARTKRYYREFWAIGGVSLEVRRGEVVGIVGRNGSGKSTLLKAICGIVNPTSGVVQTNGRIAALLELGAGFNPEFSGRENVYLNAAILGLSREEIESCFDEIQLFANIGDFIDEPIKTYSSGMFVRLAFAVAAHINPDILVIDEALSVGDIAFQNKCIERITRMVAQGVTILFVTHDLGTLQLLCSRVAWMDSGRIREIGEPVKVLQHYYIELTGAQLPIETHAQTPRQQVTGKATVTKLRVAGTDVMTFVPGDLVRIEFSVRAHVDLGPMVFGLSIYRSDGDWVVSVSSRDSGVVWPALRAGDEHYGSVDLAPLALTPGEYRLAIAAYSEDYSICFALTDIVGGFSVRAPYPTWGKFLHPCRWNLPETP